MNDRELSSRFPGCLHTPRTLRRVIGEVASEMEKKEVEGDEYQQWLATVQMIEHPSNAFLNFHTKRLDELLSSMTNWTVSSVPYDQNASGFGPVWRHTLQTIKEKIERFDRSSEAYRTITLTYFSYAGILLSWIRQYPDLMIELYNHTKRMASESQIYVGHFLLVPQRQDSRLAVTFRDSVVDLALETSRRLFASSQDSENSRADESPDQRGEPDLVGLIPTSNGTSQEIKEVAVLTGLARERGYLLILELEEANEDQKKILASGLTKGAILALCEDEPEIALDLLNRDPFFSHLWTVTGEIDEVRSLSGSEMILVLAQGSFHRLISWQTE